MHGIRTVVIAFLVIASGVAVAPGHGQKQVKPEVVFAQAPEWPQQLNTFTGQVRETVIPVKVQTDGLFGNVVDVKVLNLGTPFTAEVAKAAHLWKFAPTRRGTTVTLKFIFRLLPKNSPREELGTGFVPPYTVQVTRVTKDP